MIEDRRWWAAGAVVLAVAVAIGLWIDSGPSSTVQDPVPPDPLSPPDGSTSRDMDGSAIPSAGPEADPMPPLVDRSSSRSALRGRVWSRATSQPISGATVILSADGSARAVALPSFTTGPEGLFEIAELPKAARRITVRAAGHAVHDEILGPSRTIPLDLEIWLAPERRVAGRVVDEEGRPVAQARVAVAPGDPVTLSDENGRFDLGGLGDRPVVLWAHHPDIGVATSDELPVGREDYELMLVGPVGSCHGRVVTAEGEDPVPGARVWIEDPRLAGCEVLTDQAGLFQIDGLPAEPLRIGAAVPELGRTFARIDPRSDPRSEVVLRLPRPEPIEGYLIERTTGDPLPGIGVRLESGTQQWEGLSDSRGRFRTERPFPRAPVRLTITSEAGWVITSPQSPDGSSLERDRTGPEPWRLILAAGSAVEGVVESLDGSPVASCSVILVDESADLFSETVAWSWTDEAGRFRLGPVVRPGRHRVIARRPRLGIAWSEPLVLRSGEDLSGVLVTLQSAATLRGRLVDRGGDPVPGATISLERLDGVVSTSLGGLETTTRGEGSFRLGPIPVGSYRVSVASWESPEQIIANPWVVEADQSGLTWVFDRGARLDLTLVDDDGEPVARARVALSAPGQATVLANADRRGRVRVEGLEPGPYVVRVMPGSSFEETETECVAGGPPCEVIVPRRGSGGVVGRFLDPGGLPLRGLLWVHARSTSGEGVWWSDEMIEGRFEVPLPPAEWSLLFITAESGTRTFESVITTAETPSDLGDVLLDPAGDLEGTVVDEDGRPVAAARVSARSRWADGGGPALGTARTDELGRFRLPGLGREAVALVIEAEGYGVRTFEVDPESPPPHQIILNRGGTVTAWVRDGEGRPLSGVIVMLRPIETEAGSGAVVTRLLRSDDSGLVRFEHLSPGKYRLLGARYLRGPGFVRVHEGAETVVEVVRE